MGMNAISYAAIVIMTFCATLEARPEMLTQAAKSLACGKVVKVNHIVSIKDRGSIGLDLSDENGKQFMLVAVNPRRPREDNATGQLFEVFDLPKTKPEQIDIVAKGSDVEIAIIKPQPSHRLHMKPPES